MADVAAVIVIGAARTPSLRNTSKAPVRAGLLAKTAARSTSMQTDPPLSRASPHNRSVVLKPETPAPPYATAHRAPTDCHPVPVPDRCAAGYPRPTDESARCDRGFR